MLVISWIVDPIYWALSLDSHFVKQSTSFDSKLTKKMPTCAQMATVIEPWQGQVWHISRLCAILCDTLD